MYDPSLGRFLTQDPIGFAAGDANLYRYVGNAPTQFTDPTGLVTFNFKPDPIKNAPWHAAPGQNSGTVPSMKGTGATVVAVQGCPEIFKVKITINFSGTIYIDTNNGGPKDWRLIYGHEQLHLVNVLSELKQWVMEAEAVESAEYNTKKEAQDAADDFGRMFSESFVNQWLAREMVHQNNHPPYNRQPVEPLGGMFPPSS